MTAISAPAPLQPVYRLRLASAKDIASLHDFYDGNQHPNVNVRQRNSYTKAIRDGAVTLLIAPDGKICGSSIAWRHLGNKYTEMGSTRIVGPKNGYQFGEIMAAIQTLHVFLYAPPQDRIVAEIHCSNAQTRARMTGPILRFFPWTPNADFLKSKKNNTVIAIDTAKEYFQCGVETLPAHARHALKVLADGTLTGRDGSKVLLDMSELPIFARDRAKIVQIAKSDWGDPAKLDPVKGMRAWRDSHYPPPPYRPPVLKRRSFLIKSR
jgi:hypothetical protein